MVNSEGTILALFFLSRLSAKGHPHFWVGKDCAFGPLDGPLEFILGATYLYLIHESLHNLQIEKGDSTIDPSVQEKKGKKGWVKQKGQDSLRHFLEPLRYLANHQLWGRPIDEKSRPRLCQKLDYMKCLLLRHTFEKLFFWIHSY